MSGERRISTAPGTGAFTRRRMSVAIAAAGLGALLSRVASVSEAATTATDDRNPAPLLASFDHLFRRAGFGAGADERKAAIARGWEASVDRLVRYDQVPNDTLDLRLFDLKLDLSKSGDLQFWWLTRMVLTQRPLEEKMTLFWHGLLTSSVVNARPAEMLAQNQFLRENALADCRTILKGIGRDAAMLKWLNGATNRKAKPNENYARELMELFTLGRTDKRTGLPNYGEQDVREAARALTGFRLTGPKDAEVAEFDPRQHDTGQKTVLGRTGNWGPDDVVDIIFGQETPAYYLAARLVRFFYLPPPYVSGPGQAMVQRVAKTLLDTDYKMDAAVSAIFLSPEFRDPAAYRTLVKSPAEYLAGMYRQLDAPMVRGLPQEMTRMGQTLFSPPNVAGWAGGTSWLSTGTWLARLNAANALTTTRGGGDALGNAMRILPMESTGAFVNGVVDLLLDGWLSDDQRAAITDFAGSIPGGAASPSWRDTAGRAVVYLALASPEYHLA